jgi:hypothetical protein
MTDQDDGEILRRRIRALSAVNEQLRAQLEATQAELRTAPRQAVAVDPLGERREPVPVGLAPRRGAIAADWLGQLPAPGEPAELVEAPDGATFVLEGTQRRRVRSGLVVMAVEALLGERRPIDDDELASTSEAAPVEVLEAGTGLPFVVIGQKRLAVRGLPLPYPVDQTEADAIRPGPDLDLPAAVTPRRVHEADGWIAASAAAPSQPARLVVAPDGAAFVVEDDRRRAVPSGLLVPALAELLGDARPIEAAELAALRDAPAVEVLEAPTGEPFVVIGGRRTRVLGYPMPFPVHQDRADSLPDGPPLDIGGAPRRARTALVDERNRAAAERDRAERKTERVQAKLDAANRAAARRRANPDPAGELRALIAKKGGVAPTVTGFAVRRARKVVRKVVR